MELVTLVLALSQATAAPAPAPEAEPAPAGPVVALEIERQEAPWGTITIVLRPDKAPISVRNFLDYLRAGHYDGTIFHRVMPDFMIQGGGFTPDMVEKPQRAPIKNEARHRLRNSRGTVSMARTSDPDSATAQFFINVKDNHSLDFGIRGAGYAVFGRVIEGMEVADRIAAVSTVQRGDHQSIPTVPVVIRRAYEVEKAAPSAPASAPESPKAPSQ
jgi:peptidyl-prolyl cis-trans isomerase A (cyclophilin A)